MRKLLLDGGNSLVHAVNQRHRLSFAFEVSANVGYAPDEHTIFSVAGDALHPSFFPNGKTERLKRDKFLKLPVICVKGKNCSVHDVIDQLAHVAGGVHTGSADSDVEKALTALSAAWSFAGLPATLMQVKSIARVVLDGLAQLREKVAREGI